MAVRADIHSLRNLTDFVTTYQWSLRFDTFPRAVSSPPTTANMNIRCISADIPTFTDQPIATDIRGHKVWQPGIHNYSQTITLTMAENIDMLVNKFIRAWREACFQTGTGRHSSKDDVQCEITLVRLNRQDEAIWNYHLFGCFLSGYEQGQLNAENTTFRPTLRINYDYFTDNEGETTRTARMYQTGGNSGREGSPNS